MSKRSRKSDWEFMASKRPGHRLAVFSESVKGKMSTWPKGTKVKAWKNEDGTYSVERLRWRGSLVPLANQCYGIPKAVLKFEPRR